MSHLDQCTSFCLGVTCKRLYAAHKYIHPITSLYTWTDAVIDWWWNPDKLKVSLWGFLAMDKWFGEVERRKARLDLHPEDYLTSDSPPQ